MNLVLVADPMCSWCYGFGKEMDLKLRRVGSGYAHVHELEQNLSLLAA